MTDTPLYLILGWDTPARQAIKSLRALQMEVRIVNPEPCPQMPVDVHFVKGQPDDPRVLEAAGIRRASGILVALPAEQAGRAVAAARSLTPSIHVVASLQAPDSETALWFAGAGEVVDADKEAGLEMVRLMMDPPAFRSEDDKIYWSRVRLSADSPLIGMRLAQARGALGPVTAACLFPQGERGVCRDDDDARLRAGDVLVLLGGRGQLESYLKKQEESHGTSSPRPAP